MALRWGDAISGLPLRREAGATPPLWAGVGHPVHCGLQPTVHPASSPHSKPLATTDNSHCQSSAHRNLCP